ncbi:hypothetical protein GF377_00315, partial [candidate division GN15 bacterium]|nr:hypothetical protein [candidate division GN15 bacterium]
MCVAMIVAKALFRKLFLPQVFLLLLLAVVLAGVSPALAQTDSVKIMPLGNSITRGVAGSTDDTGYRRELYLALQSLGYVVDFVGSQSDGTPTDFDSDHEGHGGWHANQIRDNVYGYLENNPADFVLLHIGTNDVSGGDEDVAEVAAILDSIDLYETNYSRTIQVLVARIVLRADALNPTTIAFNNAVDSMVTERAGLGDDVYVVDVENALTYPDDLADNVHPNDSGYSAMADTWYTALVPILPAPTAALDSLTLQATSPANLPVDDLFVEYVLAGTAAFTYTAWYLNGSPAMSLYLPFEGGASNALQGISGNGESATLIGDPTYRPDFGHDGLGVFAFDGDDALNCGEVMPLSNSYT